MRKKPLLIVFLPFLFLLATPFVAQAASITVCNFDKDTYHQGETGYITVTIYNDRSNKMRVTELTATVDYYYADGNVYLQRFFTDTTLPVEIQPGNSSTLYIPFSLPTNIASGYTNIDVEAETELLNIPLERWFPSDHPTYQPTLHIESPYKGQLEEQVTINEQLEEQLEEQTTINEQLQEQLQKQLTTNKNATIMTVLFGATTIVFAVVTAFLFILNRKAGVIRQPVA